jgi:hypothetical protein
MSRLDCQGLGALLLILVLTYNALTYIHFPFISSKKPERDLKEHLSTFDNVPLFMKDLPADGTEDTTAIDALQSLTFDGTPDGEFSETRGKAKIYVGSS